MKTVINRYLFASTVFDSGSLGVLTSVVHQFSRPGFYHGMIMQDGRNAGIVSFEVTDTSANMQLDIDLAAARSVTSRPDCDCARAATGSLTVSPKGYVLFYASKGTGGYSVKVDDARDKTEPVFNSQSLMADDLFVLSLLEPVSYQMRNTLGSAKGEIVVNFTTKDANRLKSLETQMVEVAKDKFNPAQVRLTATQGLVFRVIDNARIVIESKARSRAKEPAVAPRRIQALSLRPPKSGRGK